MLVLGEGSKDKDPKDKRSSLAFPAGAWLCAEGAGCWEAGLLRRLRRPALGFGAAIPVPLLVLAAGFLRSERGAFVFMFILIFSPGLMDKSLLRPANCFPCFSLSSCVKNQNNLEVEGLSLLLNPSPAKACFFVFIFSIRRTKYRLLSYVASYAGGPCTAQGRSQMASQWLCPSQE